MSLRTVSAEVISCPGRLGDAHFSALQINIDGFNSPYVLTLAMPAIGYRAVNERVDTGDLYKALAKAINLGKVQVELAERGAR